MCKNLSVIRGQLFSERATTLSVEQLVRMEANELVEAASRRALDSDESLREDLLEEPDVCKHLLPEEIGGALSSAHYLRLAKIFVDRALDLYHKEVSA